MSTNILFCGDTHGRLQHVVEVALRLRPMAVVLLGDIESPRPLHEELATIRDLVWWIQGNHDTDSQTSWENLYQSELAARCIDGKVVTLADGTRLAGLGGVFRQEVWYPPEEPRHASYGRWLESLQGGWQKRPSMFQSQRLKHQSTIFPDTYFNLARQQADILVSHEAGACHHYATMPSTSLPQPWACTRLFTGTCTNGQITARIGRAWDFRPMASAFVASRGAAVRSLSPANLTNSGLDGGGSDETRAHPRTRGTKWVRARSH